jgi:nitronate monooxygenase
MLQTRFTDMLGCSVPLQQAPIGGASPRLTAAVAEAGGLGMMGAIIYPPQVLTTILDAVHAQTTGVFGVNILIPFLDRACVEVAAARARVVEFFYGDPDASLVDLAHAGGALASWQVGSRDEARRAAEVGCDFVVAQGVEAGGHVRGSLGLLPLLSEVLEFVDVPVVAAGGIGTGRAMAAALAAGAEAVRVGTRFIAAEEAEYHPTYVDEVIAARGEDTVLTEAFSAMWPHAPHRVLGSCIAAAQAFRGDVVGEMPMGDGRMPIPRYSPPAPTRETTGAVEAMALYAGQSAGSVTGRLSSAAIVRELADEAEHLLRRWY